MQAKRIQRETARRMRMDGMSVRDIAAHLGVSKGSVSVWVRDIVLTDEQINTLKQQQHRYGAQNKGARINQAKYQQQRLEFQQEGRLRAQSGSHLHMAGCMLYWAEGAKRRNSVYFVNSDPHMMLLFLRFLRDEMQVTDASISLYIHCHYSELSEQERIENYWLNLFNLPADCLRKTQVKSGSDTRKNILVNGVCGLRVNSTELAQHIFGAIQEYGGFENPDWLF